MPFIKIKNSKLNGTPLTLFGQSTCLPWLYYCIYFRSNNYVYGLLAAEEIVDENGKRLTLDQIHDAINNANLMEVIQKLKQTLRPITINTILQHPKVTETHKRLLKMYSHQ